MEFGHSVSLTWDVHARHVETRNTNVSLIEAAQSQSCLECNSDGCMPAVSMSGMES